jgi:hypothetical protein
MRCNLMLFCEKQFNTNSVTYHIGLVRGTLKLGTKVLSNYVTFYARMCLDATIYDYDEEC